MLISFWWGLFPDSTRRAVGRVTFRSKDPMMGQYVLFLMAKCHILYKLSISIYISGDIASYLFPPNSYNLLCTYQCFPPALGWRDYPRELEFLNLRYNSLSMSHKCVSKIPWTCLKIYTEFHQSKVSKLPSLCQSVLSSSWGKWFFAGLIPRISPSPPPPTPLGKTLTDTLGTC